ncbi:MAG: GGDEF domain-containing protein, partial [Actinobacteria bacterium]|nr:GGDEF domain-containing protein [Actinomycetota bacterium]
MSWPEEVDEVERRIRARLATAVEFEAMVDDLIARPASPVLSVRAHFNGPAPMPTVTVGKAGTGEPHASETWDTEDEGLFPVRTELWYSEGGNSAREAGRDAMRRLLSAWWRGDTRNEKSRLLSGQHAPTQRALEETLRQWGLEGPVLLCAADIDHFKAVNDQISWDAGDRLIAQLAATLVATVPRHMLVVHRSGDEFTIVAPHGSAGAAVADLMHIRESVEHAVRKDIDIDPAPGFSMGVAFCSTPIVYSELETIAGKALKPEGGKRHGRVTVARPGQRLVPAGVDAVELKLVLALNLLSEAEPFGDPLLDAASVMAYRDCVAAPDVSSLTARLSLSLGGFADSDGAQPLPEIHVAAAHGIVRAALTGTGPTGTNNVTIQIAHDGVTVVGGNPAVRLIGSLAPANARRLTVRIDAPVVALADSRRAVLVTIGASNLGLPNELFAATVFVDDRPTIGGGLPDLWEAALAQVVACVSRNPNVDRIFLAGQLAMGKQTVDRLMNASEWFEPKMAEMLAYKLGTPSSRIVDAGTRIGGRVVQVGSA